MTATLEHRWGRRVTLMTPIRLIWRHSELAAVLVEASASGAFIRADLSVPRWATVEVQIRSERVEAWVVRAAPDGVGIGWRDFAPPAILALTRDEGLPEPGRPASAAVGFNYVI